MKAVTCLDWTDGKREKHLVSIKRSHSRDTTDGIAIYNLNTKFEVGGIAVETRLRDTENRQWLSERNNN